MFFYIWIKKGRTLVFLCVDVYYVTLWSIKTFLVRWLFCAFLFIPSSDFPVWKSSLSIGAASKARQQQQKSLMDVVVSRTEGTEGDFITHFLFSSHESLYSCVFPIFLKADFKNSIVCARKQTCMHAYWAPISPSTSQEPVANNRKVDLS